MEELYYSVPAAAILVYASVKDAKHRIIPNRIPAGILLIAIAKGIFIPAGRPQQLLGFTVAAVFFVAIYLIFNGKGLGGGDVKLIIALGAMAGFNYLLLLLLAASFSGLLYLFIRRKKDLAFAPFLTAGYILTLIL
jgi:leader peptidase (prepilin peptidase)/N-methyltransferase